ncbi:hypothetical protein AAVH_19443 [Aphelenchoides avenae]|nr:hypothetical protein AAVH_19443 [Aphelenchus avenae]
MATPSVKRKLRSGKVFALPSTVRKPNSDAARHWLENEDCKHIATSFRDVRHTEAAKSHASQRTNRDRFPDAIVRVLRGDANLCDVAAEAGIKPAALEEVLGRVQADLYSLFGKNAASMPAAVLELLRKDPGQLASIRRLRSAKRKASKQTNPPAGTASQLLREAEETIRERDGELTEALDHIAELSRQIAALKEELAQARRGAAIDDAVSSASVQSNRTAGASLDADEGMDLDDAPGTSNNAVRANDGTTHSILKRIHHELNGSFGEPNKYVYEATFADGYVTYTF